MKIKAEIKKLFPDGGKVKAAASLTLDGVFVVRNVRLVEGSKGFFVSMPSHKNAAGEFKDICFPINSATRAQIQSEVLAACEQALQEQENASDDEGGEQETE